MSINAYRFWGILKLRPLLHIVTRRRSLGRLVLQLLQVFPDLVLPLHQAVELIIHVRDIEGIIVASRVRITWIFSSCWAKASFFLRAFSTATSSLWILAIGQRPGSSLANRLRIPGIHSPKVPRSPL